VGGTKQRLVQVGIKRLGRDELAKRLKATPELVDAWASGHATLPDRKALLLVDLLDELDALGEEP
jgi:hypothetical protein